MRKALIVGINNYQHVGRLSGCENDARKIANILSLNDDMSGNFDCEVLLSSESDVTESKLRGSLKKLFKDDADVALLFFAGHGYLDNELGGYLVTQDGKQDDFGVFMREVIDLANNSQNKIKEVVIILDCCHSGNMGNQNNTKEIARIRKGLSILAACTEEQVALESGGQGLFTSLITDALQGGAADILGSVTMAGIHSYADQLLGAWEQRPTFKTHISQMIPLRKCDAKIELKTLHKMTEYFTNINAEHQLSPDYEPTAKPEDSKKEEIFGHLQRMTALNLVKPSKEKHMYFEAINNGSCELTALGKFYWKMVDKKRI